MNIKRRDPSPNTQRVPESKIQNPKSVAPYSVLAAGYDVVMEHVEYEAWAGYVDALLKEHHPAPEAVLELACGTGSLALELQPLGPYRYAGTDLSEDMLRVARAKAELAGAPIHFARADFTDFRADPPVDVLILLYDGLNYLLAEDRIRALFRCAWRALRPGGIFLFDQSTPANSINNEPYFEDRGRADVFSYVRRSRYDRERRLHTTTLDMTVDGRSFREEHVQRAYDVAEVRALLAETPFELLALYDNFSFRPATDASERVHWVVRKQVER
jgi:SAM-dependent methyltransferase